MPMTDEQLEDYICVPRGSLPRYDISPEKRALFDRMAEVENELALWRQGLGPKPKGVIVCGPREVRGGR